LIKEQNKNEQDSLIKYDSVGNLYKYYPYNRLMEGGTTFTFDSINFLRLWDHNTDYAEKVYFRYLFNRKTNQLMQICSRCIEDTCYYNFNNKGYLTNSIGYNMNKINLNFNSINNYFYNENQLKGIEKYPLLTQFRKQHELAVYGKIMTTPSIVNFYYTKSHLDSTIENFYYQKEPKRNYTIKKYFNYLDLVYKEIKNDSLILEYKHYSKGKLLKN
jgi:hypothetical protein